MKNDGQKFLEELAGSRPDTFECQFYAASRRFGLGASFTRNELTLLYEAALLASSCNAAFNGLEGWGPKLRASDERRRWELETAFMEACDILYASPGWQTLPEEEREPLAREFLRVAVEDDRLGF